MPRDEAVLLDILQSASDVSHTPHDSDAAGELLKQAIGTIQNGDPTKGEKDLREITHVFPGYLDGWGHLAYNLFVQGQYHEAAECYRRCQEIFPGLLEAYTREADCHVHLGNYAEAASCYRRSRSLVGDPTESIVREVDCLFHAGRPREAEKILLSLRGSPSFSLEEVQSRLRLAESPFRITLRGIAQITPRVARRIAEPGLVASLLREIYRIPTSITAIRDSSFRSFGNYLAKGFLDHGLHRIKVGPCDLCGSRKSRNVFFLHDRKVVRCRNCGLERLERIPPGGHDLHTGFYERAEIVNVVEKEWSNPYVLEHHMAWLTTLFLVAGVHFPAVGGRLFEIGCGGGQLLAHLESCGMQVTGIDASSSFVESVRAKYGLNVSCTTVESLAASGEPYDYVISYHVIEHLERPSVLIEKARGLLCPGGYLFVETPVPDLRRVPVDLKHHPTHGYGSCEHSHFFTLETLGKYFERFGFQIIASYQYLAGELPNGGILGRKS